ncbi:hypothetical protein [Nocardioides sp.]|uniref:hypothetical protein n=1 Tax=Nocardioides sp. TaxID=35761 RepID=UPI002ED057CD
MTTLAGPRVSGRRLVPGRPAIRVVLAVPAAASLLVGLDGALSLLDVWSPAPGDRTGSAHGVLMTLGFVGALIALERAVALRHPAGYIAPVALAAGALLHVVPRTERVGAGLLVVGTVVLTLVYQRLWRRQRDDAVLVQALGAVLAVGATVGWLGGVPMAAVVPWLAGFLVLTIAGERLELARLGMPGSAGRLLVLAAVALSVSVLALLLWATAGPLFGLSLALVSGWLARHDVARRTVRASGLPRYMAICMLSGQVWLVAAAGVWLLADPAVGGPAYDAAVHAVFLGFTMSMVMAHAPVILPVVARVKLPFHPLLYAPLLLLQLGLVVRLWAGDALGTTTAWQVGGVLTVAALIGFMGCVFTLAATSHRWTS